MANLRYVGDYGQSVVLPVTATQLDIQAGDTAVILAKKPYQDRKEVVTWTGVVDAGANTVSYTFQTGDLDVAGRWQLMLKVTNQATTVVTRSDPINFDVGEAFDQ